MPNKKNSQKNGFFYYISLKKIREYQQIPFEKRLAWLYQGNLFRSKYPQKIRKIQDKLRSGTM